MFNKSERKNGSREEAAQHVVARHVRRQVAPGSQLFEGEEMAQRRRAFGGLEWIYDGSLVGFGLAH
jgi:hypothetical protein